MRIWTIHPKYLDSKGLVALWREALLAQKVLQGNTRGYRNHPQLFRFRELPNSLDAISSYLVHIHEESVRRGYRFDQSKIVPTQWDGIIEETTGQLLYEWQHFLNKVETRDPEVFDKLEEITLPDSHPTFKIVDGEIRDWEKL